MEDLRRVKQALRWIPDEEEIEVDDASPGEMWCGETANRWTWLAKTCLKAPD